MSHWNTFKPPTEVRDIEALRAACAHLGLPLLTGVQARGYSRNTMDCTHVIKCTGLYDVAVQVQPDGTYTFTTDWYEGHDGTTGQVAKCVGKDYAKLMAAYGAHHQLRRTQQAARAQGAYSTVSRIPGTNKLRLVIQH